MKIAMITISYNDDYKFKEWCNYYDEYKDDIDYHIIVDNGSEERFLKQVEDYFTSSIIIKRTTNGGCTSAYNDGLRYILDNTDADAIALWGNDVRIRKGDMRKLYDYLYSEDELGMVAPVVLRKDSNIIEDFGVKINSLRVRYIYKGDNLSCISGTKRMHVDLVPGGINLSKRAFYEKVGLQDENIFMYCDERDMYYRAKKCGFIEGVTAEAVSWHQHIASPHKGKRLDSTFLIARNRTYLEKKHNGFLAMFLHIIASFVINSVILLRHIFNPAIRFKYRRTLAGLYCGAIGRMSNVNLWY